MTLTITVRGEHTRHVPPERASVYIVVYTDGPDKDATLDTTLRSLDTVTRGLEPLTTDGAVERWSADSVRVTAQRPWNQDGAQLPPVYLAAASVRATFTDFDVLGQWLDTTARLPGVRVETLQWELTDDTRARTLSEARTDAVADAVTKAIDFATAVGRGTPTPTEIADHGMLGTERPQPVLEFAGASRSAASFASDDGTPTLSLTPENITVSCTVEARFAAH